MIKTLISALSCGSAGLYTQINAKKLVANAGLEYLQHDKNDSYDLEIEFITIAGGWQFEVVTTLEYDSFDIFEVKQNGRTSSNCQSLIAIDSAAYDDSTNPPVDFGSFFIRTATSPHIELFLNPYNAIVGSVDGNNECLSPSGFCTHKGWYTLRVTWHHNSGGPSVLQEYNICLHRKTLKDGDCPSTQLLSCCDPAPLAFVVDPQDIICPFYNVMAGHQQIYIPRPDLIDAVCEETYFFDSVIDKEGTTGPAVTYSQSLDTFHNVAGWFDDASAMNSELFIKVRTWSLTNIINFRGTYDITIIWKNTNTGAQYDQQVRICICTSTYACEELTEYPFRQAWIVAKPPVLLSYVVNPQISSPELISLPGLEAICVYQQPDVDYNIDTVAAWLPVTYNFNEDLEDVAYPADLVFDISLDDIQSNLCAGANQGVVTQTIDITGTITEKTRSEVCTGLDEQSCIAEDNAPTDCCYWSTISYPHCKARIPSSTGCLLATQSFQIELTVSNCCQDYTYVGLSLDSIPTTLYTNCVYGPYLIQDADFYSPYACYQVSPHELFMDGNPLQQPDPEWIFEETQQNTYQLTLQPQNTYTTKTIQFKSTYSTNALWFPAPAISFDVEQCLISLEFESEHSEFFYTVSQPQEEIDLPVAILTNAIEICPQNIVYSTSMIDPAEEDIPPFIQIQAAFVPNSVLLQTDQSSDVYVYWFELTATDFFTGVFDTTTFSIQIEDCIEGLKFEAEPSQFYYTVNQEETEYDLPIVVQTNKQEPCPKNIVYSNDMIYPDPETTELITFSTFSSVLSMPKLTVYTKENNSTNEYMFQLTAQDTDSGMFATHSYNITIEPVPSVFFNVSETITSQTIEVTYTEEIDNETAAITSSTLEQAEFATCKINSVSAFGLVTIETSQPVVTRQVNDTTEDLQDIMQVNHVPYDRENEIVLQPNVTLKDFNRTLITIQLEYENPLLVSQGDFLDQIQVTLLKSHFLEPSNINLEQQIFLLSQLEEVGFHEELVSVIPRQLYSESEAEALKTMGTAVQLVMIATLGIPIIVQLFLKGVSTKLWFWLNAMQILDSLLLLGVNTPQNVVKLQLEYHAIAYFDVKTLLSSIVTLVKGDSDEVEQSSRRMLFDNTQSANVSQEYQVWLLNMFNIDAKFVWEDILVLFSVILLIGAAIGMLTLVLHKCWKNLSKKVRKRILTVRSKLMFNPIIRYTLQSYYLILLSSMYYLKFTFTKEEYASTSNTVMSIIFLLIMSIFSFFCYKFMHWNAELLSTKKFKKSFGSLYLPGECYDHKGVLLLPLLFCLRRFATAVVIVWFSEAVILQVFLVSTISLCHSIWAVQTQPMDSTLNNAIFIFNEYFMLFACDFVLIFTGYTHTVYSQHAMGYVYIGLILLSIAVNVTFLVTIFVIDAKTWFSLKKRRQLVYARHAQKLRILEQSPENEKQTHSRQRKHNEIRLMLVGGPMLAENSDINILNELVDHHSVNDLEAAEVQEIEEEVKIEESVNQNQQESDLKSDKAVWNQRVSGDSIVQELYEEQKAAQDNDQEEEEEEESELHGYNYQVNELHELSLKLKKMNDFNSALDEILMLNEEENIEVRLLTAGNIEEVAERERLELEIVAPPKELSLLQIRDKLKLLPKQSKSSKPMKPRHPQNRSDININYIKDKLVLLKTRQQKRNVSPTSSPSDVSDLTQTEESKDVINTESSKVQAILNDYYSLKLNKSIQQGIDTADINFPEEESEVQVPSKTKENSDKSETEEEETSESDVLSETSKSESEIQARNRKQVPTPNHIESSMISMEVDYDENKSSQKKK